ncbi:MAG: T9SS type A sorting domain-containing protein, partial [Bacteroidetes bacterium]|nr:T9SS type A sorting domain-containing protein [Bacteroidota bacterium]
SLKIWPAAGRTAFSNKFKLKGINMILRPHPLMEFAYAVPAGTTTIPVALNVTSEGTEGTAVLIDIPITDSRGSVFVNIDEVFEMWDQENPGKEWKHLQDIDVWFFPETSFTGSEEITIDDFMLGFNCLTKRDFEIEISGQDTIITEVGIPFYMSVDKLDLSLISSEFPGERFPVTDPYALPGYPRVNIYEGEGYEVNSNIITPGALDVNPIIMPVDVVIGGKQTAPYDFRIYIHEFIAGREDLSQSRVEIYPNPFNEGFHIKNFENIKRLKVYSRSGTLVKSTGPKRGFVDMSGLEPGLFLLEIHLVNGERHYAKLMKN